MKGKGLVRVWKMRKERKEREEEEGKWNWQWEMQWVWRDTKQSRHGKESHEGKTAHDGIGGHLKLHKFATLKMVCFSDIKLNQSARLNDMKIKPWLGDLWNGLVLSIHLEPKMITNYAFEIFQ